MLGFESIVEIVATENIIKYRFVWSANLAIVVFTNHKKIETIVNKYKSLFGLFSNKQIK